MKYLLLPLLGTAILAFAACQGLLNFGRTNEDGSAKAISTGAEAIIVARAFADAALIVWGMPAAQKHAPELIPVLDTNKDGKLTVAEITERMQGDDRTTIRAAINTALQTWGTAELAKRAPAVVPLFDVDGNGIELAEIEAKVDLSQPDTLAPLIAAAMILWKEKPK